MLSAVSKIQIVGGVKFAGFGTILFACKLTLLIDFNMTLTNDKILSYRARFNDKWKIFDYALNLHKRRIENKGADIETIEFPLEEDAFDFHMYLFGNVPASTFQEYVNYVHEKTGRPNYLAGWPGVIYVEGV